MATERVLMWSATTLYAMSTLSASSGPTLPEYGGAPVAYEKRILRNKCCSISHFHLKTRKKHINTIITGTNVRALNTSSLLRWQRKNSTQWVHTYPTLMRWVWRRFNRIWSVLGIKPYREWVGCGWMGSSNPNPPRNPFIYDIATIPHHFIYI